MPPLFHAKHRSASGQPLVQVSVPRYYNLDEAARALAQVFPARPPKFGKRSIQRGLTEAASRGITGKRELGDTEAVAGYRQALLEFGVFPEPDGE